MGETSAKQMRGGEMMLNPWDAQLNFDMAEACRDMEFNEAAIFGFQKAKEADPDNKNYLRNLALILEERGSYTDAVKCWDIIHKQISWTA